MPLTSVSLSCGRFVFRFSEVEFVPRPPEFRQVIPSTKCRCSTLHWATGAALWIPGKGLPLASRAGVVTLHPPQSAPPLYTPASKSKPAFRGYARQMQAFAVASRPAASLRTPSKGLPLAFRAGAPPCTRFHTKNGIVLIPLFVWIRRPDTALVSPSATQAAHKIIGKVEIFIRDFAFPTAFIRSADPLHGAWQIAHCFGYCLAHDGLQRIGIRKTGSAVSFFCQRFHDEGCIGARPASQFFQGQTMTGIVQVQPNSEIELVLILQSQHPACGAPLPPAADILWLLP